MQDAFLALQVDTEIDKFVALFTPPHKDNTLAVALSVDMVVLFIALAMALSTQSF